MSGVSKFGPRLRELRIHLCQTGEASKGVRQFIEKHYVGIKKNNPKFPILIRECSGVQPTVWARYEKGKEVNVPLSNLGVEEVLQQIQKVTQN